jgi:SAM-dependent methyltransferase
MSTNFHNHNNLRAYATTEAIESFSSPESVHAYRRARIAKYQLVVDFISRRVEEEFGELRVVEIGSGSSALLYALDEKKLLKYGCGIEISKSRFNFAELWKSEIVCSTVENINRSFADVNLQHSTFDWFIVIDNTFTYLHPVDEPYPRLMLDCAFTALKPEGKILLDFFNYSKRTPGIESQQWNIFSKSDPFSYGLYSHKIENGINTSKTIFVRRKTQEEQIKIELSKVYSLQDIGDLLAKSGFVVSEVFSDFGESSYREEVSERLLVVASKVKQ